MINPAREHKQAVLAQQAAAIGDIENMEPYQQLQYQMSKDKQLLKAIKGIPDKAIAKRDMLPKYQNWLDEVLASDAPNPADSVFTTATLWLIDSGQLNQAMPYALFAIRHQMQVVDDFQRSIADLLVEELAAQIEAGQDIDRKNIEELAAMLTEKNSDGMHLLNIFDPVRAKFFKAAAEWYEAKEETEHEAAAIRYYQLALTYNPKAGVKKRIAALEKQQAVQTGNPS